MLAEDMKLLRTSLSDLVAWKWFWLRWLLAPSMVVDEGGSYCCAIFGVRTLFRLKPERWDSCVYVTS